MSDYPPSQGQDKTSKTTRILLILSLALNLVILGGLAGMAIGHWNHGDDKVKRAYLSPNPLVRALEKDERKEVSKAIRRTHEERGLDRQADRANYREIVALLLAEDLDRGALTNALETRVAATVKRLGSAQEAWLEVVEDMDMEDRREYAERLEEVLEKGHKKRDRKED